MKTAAKFFVIAVLSILAMLLAMGIGSVFIPSADIVKILLKNLFGITAGMPVSAVNESIFWKIRLPRVILAFLCGGGLAVSGVMTQSVLRNPLASSYTIGVSSGAAVGACIAIITGFTFFGRFTVSFFGLAFGLLTVFSAVALASKLDKTMKNSTIILTGMAFSLFASSIITFIMSLRHEDLQRIIFWQMGSFASKDWSHSVLIFIVSVIIIPGSVLLSGEMDIMTFGEEQAKSSGVNVSLMKRLILTLSTVMTGFIVSIAGIIGFVDLFTPHVARKLFGSRHILVIPASALLGGLFMVLCDLAARTVAAPLELPVGAVTSAIGAPFFLYIYFSGRKDG